MAKIVKVKGTRYRINSYTGTGDLAHADFYSSVTDKMGSHWHPVLNYGYRRMLAKKFPKKSKKGKKR